MSGGGYTPIDLSRLPAPSVVQPLDYESVLTALRADLIARAPELADALDLESEPVTKLLEVFAYREMVLRAHVNDSAKAVMLAFAAGPDLDHLAALVETARLPGEDDESLRRRAQLAWEGLSAAGPVGAYHYHALSAHPQVRDALISSPAPGDVLVTVLGTDGDGTPSAEVLAAVAAHLNADDVRPLTDTVTVAAAAVIPYALTAELTLYPGPSAAPVLAAAQAAAEAETKRLHALGHRVTLSALYAALHQPGVQRVNLIAPPADIAPGAHQAAYCTAITLTEAGRDT